MGAGGASLLHPPGGGRVKPVESTPRPVHPHKRWQRQFHPDSGEAYYVDVDTGVTSWVASEPTAPTAAAAPNPAAPAPELAQRQLELEAVAAAAAQPPERMRKQQVRAVSWEPLTRRAAPRQWGVAFTLRGVRRLRRRSSCNLGRRRRRRVRSRRRWTRPSPRRGAPRRSWRTWRARARRSARSSARSVSQAFRPAQLTKRVRSAQLTQTPRATPMCPGLAEMTVAVAREKMAREAAQLEASTQAEHAAVAQAQAQELYARMRQVRSLTRRLGQAVGSPCLGVCTHCDPISHDVCAISLAPAADNQSLRHPLRPPSLS
jgi:hypothetical protein